MPILHKGSHSFILNFPFYHKRDETQTLTFKYNLSTGAPTLRWYMVFKPNWGGIQTSSRFDLQNPRTTWAYWSMLAYCGWLLYTLLQLSYSWGKPKDGLRNRWTLWRRWIYEGIHEISDTFLFLTNNLYLASTNLLYINLHESY